MKSFGGIVQIVTQPLNQLLFHYNSFAQKFQQKNHEKTLLLS